jgi:hypothetical protein
MLKNCNDALINWYSTTPDFRGCIEHKNENNTANVNLQPKKSYRVGAHHRDGEPPSRPRLIWASEWRSDSLAD